MSSPNTPGLRDLQQSGALDDLLAGMSSRRAMKRRKASWRKPAPLKIAPDLSLAELDAVVACARARRIDGLIVSNTTFARPKLADCAQANEPGGLSGRPLFALSTQMLAAAYLRVEGQFPLIGVGGVDSAARALAKIEAGASLVQLYSALVFKGLGLPAAIKQGLLAGLDRGGYQSLVTKRGGRVRGTTPPATSRRSDREQAI